VDDYVTAGNGASLDITNNLSAFVWAKTSDTESLNSALSKYTTTGNDRSWLIRFRESAGSPTKGAVTISDDGTFTAGHLKYYITSIDVVDGNWHYFGFTFSSGVLKLYVDGIQDTAVAKTYDDAITAIYSSLSDVTIGVYDDGLYNFNGTIDEVKIWNRALSPEEITHPTTPDYIAYTTTSPTLQMESTTTLHTHRIWQEM